MWLPRLPERLARRTVAETVPKADIDGAERRYQAPRQTLLDRNIKHPEARNYSVGTGGVRLYCDGRLN